MDAKLVCHVEGRT